MKKGIISEDRGNHRTIDTPQYLILKEYGRTKSSQDTRDNSISITVF